MDKSWESALILYKCSEEMKGYREGRTLKKRMIGVLASCRKEVDHFHRMRSSSMLAGLGVSELPQMYKRCAGDIRRANIVSCVKSTYLPYQLGFGPDQHSLQRMF